MPTPPAQGHGRPCGRSPRRGVWRVTAGLCALCTDAATEKSAEIHLVCLTSAAREGRSVTKGRGPFPKTPQHFIPKQTRAWGTRVQNQRAVETRLRFNRKSLYIGKNRDVRVKSGDSSQRRARLQELLWSPTLGSRSSCTCLRGQDRTPERLPAAWLAKPQTGRIYFCSQGAFKGCLFERRGDYIFVCTCKRTNPHKG